MEQQWWHYTALFFVKTSRNNYCTATAAGWMDGDAVPVVCLDVAVIYLLPYCCLTVKEMKEFIVSEINIDGD